jgi:hypothetical protein
MGGRTAFGSREWCYPIFYGWTPMLQFLMDLNIQSNLIFRLKCVRARHFSCASSSIQPCLYFPMLLYNPL